jgi:hypothetical protein
MQQDNLISSLILQVEKSLSDLHRHLKENTSLILVLSFMALAAYGFELFNFNLTIDEEIHATYSAPTVGWLSQGRWGMYLLNMILLPYTIIPFVPLFTALVFHIMAAVLLLESWEVISTPDRFVVGAIYVTFPTLAYMYNFSTISYGIGIGLFCIALSSFLFSKNDGPKRFLAVIPASFAIAIYQGFIPALAAVYLVYILSVQIRATRPIFRDILAIFAILILSLLIYYGVQRLILKLGIIPELSYVTGFFDLGFFRRYFHMVWNRVWLYSLLPIYSGDKEIYSVRLTGMVILLVSSFLGLCINLFRSKSSGINKIIAILFWIVLLSLPFLSGLLMQFSLSVRFLLALPAVIAGVVMLGMMNSSRLFKIFLTMLASYCIFQFITSTNHLFAASHLALEADRLLASRLIGRIEDAQAEAGMPPVKYLEVVGYYSRPPTELIPKIETFGASFFEWDAGSSYRIAILLQTVGLSKLDSLTLDQRAQMVSIVDLMSAWPHRDSIRIVNETVLVKFGDYSYSQKAVICSTKQSRSHLYDKSFCRDMPK